ncbi:MAG: hypothetical protein ACRDLV_05110 [Solirubrobacteraceae bacterium]
MLTAAERQIIDRLRRDQRHSNPPSVSLAVERVRALIGATNSRDPAAIEAAWIDLAGVATLGLCHQRQLRGAPA